MERYDGERRAMGVVNDEVGNVEVVGYVVFVLFVFFFFSSRRRHTRYIGDWSSDVCSSDLPPLLLLTGSRCGSAPAFYTAHFSLRQRPHFLKCPSLVAAAPHFFILPISRCGDRKSVV